MSFFKINAHTSSISVNKIKCQINQTLWSSYINSICYSGFSKRKTYPLWRWSLFSYGMHWIRCL